MIKKEYREFRSLHANTIIRYASIFTILFIISSIAVCIASWNKLPTEVPLWYSKPWGKDRLANPLWLFFLPGASFFWYMLNSFLSLHTTKNHQILFLSALLVSIFSFVTLGMIIWIIS